MMIVRGQAEVEHTVFVVNGLFGVVRVRVMYTAPAVHSG